MASRISVLFLLPFFLEHASASENFIGSWKTVEVIEGQGFPWHREVKYPIEFTISMDGTRLVGSYRDQNDFTCDFALAEVVNNHSELLLVHCGTSKIGRASCRERV